MYALIALLRIVNDTLLQNALIVISRFPGNENEWVSRIYKCAMEIACDSFALVFTSRAKLINYKTIYYKLMKCEVELSVIRIL